jgi:hypothetical protein
MSGLNLEEKQELKNRAKSYNIDYHSLKTYKQLQKAVDLYEKNNNKNCVEHSKINCGLINNIDMEYNNLSRDELIKLLQQKDKINDVVEEKKEKKEKKQKKVVKEKKETTKSIVNNKENIPFDNLDQESKNKIIIEEISNNKKNKSDNIIIVKSFDVNTVAFDIVDNKKIGLRSQLMNKLKSIGKNKREHSNHELFDHYKSLLCNKRKCYKWKINTLEIWKYKMDKTKHTQKTHNFELTLPKDITEEELKFITVSYIAFYYSTEDSDIFLHNLEITAVKYTQKKLSQMKMKSTKLEYRLLGDCEIVKNNCGFEWHKDTYTFVQRNGYCVIDYIFNELVGNVGYVKLKKQTIIDQFAKFVDIEKGISLDDIIEWRDTNKLYISIYALDLMHVCFEKSVSKFDTNKNSYVCLTFMIGNNHLYPITKDHLKKQIRNTGKLELDDVINKIEFNNNNVSIINYKYNSINTEYDNFLIGNPDNKDIVLINGKDIRDVIHDIHAKTHIVVDQFQFRGTSLVNAFLHPKNGKYVCMFDEYDDRKKTCKILFNEHNIEQFVFKNQSFQMIATTLYKFKFGKIPESSYNDKTAAILDKYSCSPIIQTVRKYNFYQHLIPDFEDYIETDDKYVGIDIIKCYASIMFNHKDVKIPIYTIADDVEDYVVLDDFENMKIGEYYINDVSFPNKFVIPGKFYHYNVIKYLLRNKFIKQENIKYQLIPKCQRYITMQTFSEFVEYIFLTFDKNVSKKLINHFIGNLNTKYTKKNKACITNDYNSICALWSESIINDKDVTINKVGELFMVREHSKHRKLKNNSSIWRTIVGFSLVNILEMMKEFCGIKTKFVGCNTDAIYLINPNKKYNKLKDANSLQNIKGKDYFNCIGKYLCEEPHAKQYSIIKNENLDINNYAAKIGTGFITKGCGGSGKTYRLVQDVKNALSNNKKVAVLSFQNSVCNVLRARLGENEEFVHTIDSFLNTQQDELYGYLKLNSIDIVFIDEYTQPAIHLYEKIYTAFLEFDIQINLYGDENQCHAIDSFYKINYNGIGFIKQMCPNVVELEYIEKSGRYNNLLFLILQKYLNTGSTYNFTKFKKYDNSLNINLCGTNIKRININKDRANKFPGKKQNFVFTYKHKKEAYDVCIGMPVMASANLYEHKIYNSNRAVIIDITDKEVEICHNHKNVKFSYYNFKNSFTLAFCMTTSKYQSDCIDNHYNIYEPQYMDKNMLYTALSRSTNHKYIHIENYKNYYKPIDYSEVVIELHNIFSDKFKNGKIYQVDITKKNGDILHYVGSTHCSIEKRLASHKSDVSSQVCKNYDVNNDKIEINLICNYPCFSERELETKENIYINECKIKYDDKCVNLKGFKKDKIIVDNTKKLNIKKQITINKHLNKDNETGYYMLSYIDPDNKRVQKKARFGKRTTEQEAYRKMKLAEIELVQFDVFNM